MRNRPKLAIAVALSMIMCSWLMTATTYAISNIDYHYSKWVHVTTRMPALVEEYKSIYPYGLFLSVIASVVGVSVIAGKMKNLQAMAYSFGIIIVLHIGWFFLWLLATYIANQTFIS